MIRRPPRSTLFPYTTLFRSQPVEVPVQLELGHLGLVVGPLGPLVADEPLEDVFAQGLGDQLGRLHGVDRKSTRLNSSHLVISYAVFCLKKKKKLQSRSVTSR